MSINEETERHFLATVWAYAPAIGYGRMLQIISHAWYHRALRGASCPPSGVLVTRDVLGLLSVAQQAAFVHAAVNDPLFKEVADVGAD